MWLFNFVWSLLHPRFWLQNNPYSSEWDKQLRQLMRDHRFTCIDKHTAMLGGTCIWISNYPYAAFSPYGPVPMNIRPARRTIKKAHVKLVRDSFREEDAPR